MKQCILWFAAMTLLTSLACGQPPRDRPEPPPNEVISLFDADNDGELSAEEIANASAVLKNRDRDRNGVITRDELPRPPRPGEGGRDRDGGDFRARGTESASTDAPAGSVVFRGGYQTDQRDSGRPVALIAAALGVKPEVFRDAFSRVTPARGGPPTRAQEESNKRILMAALARHGISNERLDEVSNYYRYKPQDGGLWRHTPATAEAIMKEGKVVGLRIINAGSGYLTPPDVMVVGHRDVKVRAEIEFSRDFSANGRVTKLTLIDE